MTSSEELATVQVTAVLYRLARAMDTRDWPLLATCFTADAVGRFATGDVAGYAAIEAQYRQFLTPLDTTQHLVTNTEVDAHGDTAGATSLFHAQHVRALPDGTGHFLIGGRYDDRLTRTSTGWRVTERRVTGLWTTGDRRVIAQTLRPLPPAATTPTTARAAPDDAVSSRETEQ